MKKSVLTIVKVALVMVIICLTCFIFYFESSFIPNAKVEFILWKCAFPLLVTMFISIYIFVYCFRHPEGGKLDRMVMMSKVFDSKNSRWHNWLIDIVAIVALPAAIVFGIESKIALYVEYFSKQHFAVSALVTDAFCSGGRHPSFDLTFATNKTSSEQISLSYNICIANDSIENIAGKKIILYGENSTLGRFYEGFIYQGIKYQ